MVKENKIHPLLKNFIPLVEIIGKMFGKNCEVVLHDITRPQSSIIAISNGHVTGRKVGGPMTEKGLKVLRNKEYEKKLIKYKSITKDGKTLKSSTFFIRDEKDNFIGALCINLNISEFEMAKNVINDLIHTLDDENIKQEEETYGNNINDILYSVVNKVLDNLGKPIAYTNKEEKVEIVKKLDEKGTFLIKGAVDYVADMLCVSRYTIYNYLDEVRID